MDNYFTCLICRQEHPLEERVEFDGGEVCPNCMEKHTVVCRHCDKRIWRSSNEGTEDHPLCVRCFENHYTFCSRCGTLLHEGMACYYGDTEEDEEPYCSSCYALVAHCVIHNYSYKPQPIFYGEGKRYFGVELEIDGAGESNSNGQKLLDVTNQAGEYIYLKSDSSLDEGIEVITHPMTLSFHRNQMPWKQLLQTAIDLGYSSHQARTCGLHIHVNRTALGMTEEAQDAVIGRILWFFELHWPELVKASRRTTRQLERWSNRLGIQPCPQDILKKAKDGRAGRYVAVNLLNDATIEFRLFRGSLRLQTVLATLELVDRILDCAVNLTDEEMQQLSWPAFASACQEPELVSYLRERRLYVNELVPCVQEV